MQASHILPSHNNALSKIRQAPAGKHARLWEKCRGISENRGKKNEKCREILPSLCHNEEIRRCPWGDTGGFSFSG